MGFVFSMAYPESLLLALIVFAAIAALDRHWLEAAVLTALAALTRPEALLLAIPLAAIARRQWSTLDSGGRGRALAAVLAAPTALLTFLLYLQWALGDALAWSKAEEPWGRSFRLDGVLRAVEHLPRLLREQPLLGRDAALLALYASLLVVAAWRTSLPLEWIVAAALVLVLPLFSGTVESEGRFGLLALPVYSGRRRFDPAGSGATRGASRVARAPGRRRADAPVHLAVTGARAARNAATVRSTSSSLVCQFETEMRIARRSSQTVPPSQRLATAPGSRRSRGRSRRRPRSAGAPG